MKKLAVISLLGFIVSIYLTDCLNKWNHDKGIFPKKGQAGNVIIPGTPPSFHKNDHVKRKVTISNEQYHINYNFKDHQGYARNWEVTFPESLTDEAVKKLGVPAKMLEPYYPKPEVIRQRKEWLESGMFRNSDNILIPDFGKIATYYKGYTKPIADYARMVLGSNASQDETVDFLLRFCQDIPYGVPPSYYQGKYTGQIFSPAHVLVNMFADCDSKAAMFASAYSHLRPENVLFVHTPGHLSIAIQGIPKPYQKGMTYKNIKYIFAEPVGPGRSNFGQENMSTEQIDRIDESSIGNRYPDANYELLSSVETRRKSEYIANGGQVTVYLKSSDYGHVTIYIDGEELGDLTSFFKSKPQCGASGCVTFTREMGDYHFKAVSSTGVYWEGNITIGTNDCFLMGIGD